MGRVSEGERRTQVLVEPLGEGVVRVRLHGPRTRGAQTPQTWQELREAADGLPAGTRVVVLTGSQGAFSSGLDRAVLAGLPELGRLPAEPLRERIAGYQRAFTCWRRPGVLSVAAVDGPAVGAGLQLALACDLRLASSAATFRMAETSWGLVPDLGGTRPLVRAVGEQAALEICLTGRTVAAAEALRLGLVRAVVAADELEQATDDLVRAVCAAPEAAVRATLDLLRGAGDRDEPAQLAAERAAQARLLRAAAETGGPASGPPVDPPRKGPGPPGVEAGDE